MPLSTWVRKRSTLLCVATIGLTAYLLGLAVRDFSSDAPPALQPNSVRLASGYNIPLLGFGTYALPAKHTAEAVRSALKVGYRHIDTAVTYKNEGEVGVAIAEWLNAGKGKREDLFITTKLWSNQKGRQQVIPAIKESLQKLQLDYLDLVLIHWPVTSKPGPELTPTAQETWEGMSEAVDHGLVRSIGVSNHSPEKIQAWFGNSRVPVSVNQVESHPNWRNDRVVDWCRQNRIHVTAYSPLTTPGQMAVKSKNVPNLLQDERVKRVASKLGKTPAQVLLAWGMQRGISVIPKATSPSHQQDNAGSLGWALPAEDFGALSEFSPQVRCFEGDGFISEQGPWHTYEELWDEKPLA